MRIEVIDVLVFNEIHGYTYRIGTSIGFLNIFIPLQGGYPDEC